MLNQNYNERVVMNTSYTEPISSPCSGVERLLLERSEDSEYAISTTLVTFHEDAKFDEHQHDGGEELFVLEGTFSDEFGDYPTGTYIRNPRKSKHSPYSVNGCKLFVKLRQFQTNDNKQILLDTKSMEWIPGLVRGLHVLPLHSFKHENTALVRWEPNTKFLFHQHWGGEEIFVIDGTFYDEYGKYPKHSWLRNPHQSKHTPYTLDDGALIFVKTGHLLRKDNE